MAGPLANARYELFAQEIVKGAKEGAAYVTAGFKPDAGNPSRLLARPDVAARIMELKEAAAERVEITTARVLAELGKIGFSDIRKLFEDDGRLKHITMLDDDTAACISSIEVVAQKRKRGDGEADELEVENTVKVKLWDKKGALVDIGKHLGMFKEGLPDPAQINVNIGDSDLARLIVFHLTKTTKATE